jgi:hypothetical protein
VLGGRPAQEAALGTIARTLTSGVSDVDTLPWERLRHQGSRQKLARKRR